MVLSKWTLSILLLLMMAQALGSPPTRTIELPLLEEQSVGKHGKVVDKKVRRDLTFYMIRSSKSL